MTLGAFITATLTRNDVVDKYDIAVGAGIDLSQKTDEELTEIGNLIGQAYTKLLIQAKEGKLE